MTNEEAIKKIEFVKNGYKLLAQSEVSSGIILGEDVEGVWESDKPLKLVYDDIIKALDLAIELLENPSIKRAYESGYKRGQEEPKKSGAESEEEE